MRGRTLLLENEVAFGDENLLYCCKHKRIVRLFHFFSSSTGIHCPRSCVSPCKMTRCQCQKHVRVLASTFSQRPAHLMQTNEPATPAANEMACYIVVFRLINSYSVTTYAVSAFILFCIPSFVTKHTVHWLN